MRARTRHSCRWLLAILALFSILSLESRAEESGDSLEAVLEVHMSDSGVKVVTENGTRKAMAGAEDFADDSSSRPHRYDDKDGRFYFDDDVVVGDDETVPDALVVLFGDLDVYGKVRGDVVVVMGDLTLHDQGSIGGDAVCLGGDVSSDSTAAFQGEVVCFPVSALLTGKGWNVLNGSPLRTRADGWIDSHPSHRDHHGLRAFGRILKLLGMLLLAWLLHALFRRRVVNVTDTLHRRPWKCLLLGLLYFFGLIVLFIPLLITLVLLLAFLAIILSPIPPLMILVLLAFLLSVSVIVLALVFVPAMVPILAFSRFTWEERGVPALLSLTLWVLIAWGLASLFEWPGGLPAALAVFVEFLFYAFGIGAMLASRMGSVFIPRRRLEEDPATGASADPSLPESESEPPPAEA